MAHWDGIGRLLIRFSHASSSWNSTESMAGAGPGPGRNWSPRVISHGFQVPCNGSSGSVPTYIPGPVGTVPVHFASEPPVAARVSAFWATAWPRANPASTSLR
jgi:hypothetical protein